MPTAQSVFTVVDWNEEASDERDGVTIARARLSKSFVGDIEGSSLAEILTVRAPGESSAYVGFERFVVNVHGRAGTFILQHCATAIADERTTSWTVVPGSGTGELEAIAGTAEIVVDEDGGHLLALDYELESSG
jgi:hypothetical protein